MLLLTQFYKNLSPRHQLEDLIFSSKLHPNTLQSIRVQNYLIRFYTILTHYCNLKVEMCRSGEYKLPDLSLLFTSDRSNLVSSLNPFLDSASYDRL